MGASADVGGTRGLFVLTEAPQSLDCPAPTRGTYVLTLLFLAYVLNFIDRQIVTILQEPIKAELGLSDTQLGLLTGLAFALFYATMGLPLAWLADRKSRRGVIAAAMTVWSGFTMLSGAATGFWSLLAARVGVGVGEAGLTPAAHSLISDTFPPERRAATLAIYSSGIQVGVMLGFLLGGAIGHWFGWRAAFVAAGVPGIVLALLIRFTLPEPPRGRYGAPGIEGTPSSSRQNSPLRIAAFRFAALGCGFQALVLYGQGQWAPPYLSRVHGLGLTEVAGWLALFAIGPGAAGIWLSGFLTDRLRRRFARASLWIAIGSISLMLPLELGYAFAPSATAALILWGAIQLLGGVYLAPMISFAHDLVEPRRRATASALLLLAINLIGLGLGPLAVGRASDVLTPAYGADALRYALLCILPAQVLAIGFFALAARSTGRMER